MARKREKVEAGSGDVFVDLGFADAGERRLRVQLAMRINELIAGYGFTQAKAAVLFGVPQPHGPIHQTCAVDDGEVEALPSSPDVDTGPDTNGAPSGHGMGV